MVDFSKLSQETLEEYGIEIYASYEAVFEDLFLSDDEFSVRDAVELLKNDTMQEVVEAQPYVYKFGDKYYRWTEDELMGELAEKYPDAVVFCEHFETPERFYRRGDEIVAVPVDLDSKIRAYAEQTAKQSKNNEPQNKVNTEREL